VRWMCENLRDDEVSKGMEGMSSRGGYLSRMIDAKLLFHFMN